MEKIEQLKEYGLFVGSRVEHKGDPGIFGTVIHIDENLYDITTCSVVWDDADEGVVSIQWTNKLILKVD